jgi:hypothetical protein
MFPHYISTVLVQFAKINGIIEFILCSHSMEALHTCEMGIYVILRTFVQQYVNHWINNHHCIYIYMYVCVRERERERERDKDAIENCYC